MGLRLISFLLILMGTLASCEGVSDTKVKAKNKIVPQKPTGGQNQKKLGDLLFNKYKSINCLAEASGVDQPKQLLLTYKCGWLERSHRLICPSEYSCFGQYGQNQRIEVEFSTDYKRIVIIWYNSEKEISDSENLVAAEQNSFNKFPETSTSAF